MTSKRRIQRSTGRKRAIMVEDEIVENFYVPTLMDFVEAFSELIESAARRSVSEDLLPKLDEFGEFENYKDEVVKNAKEIWCLFLERFDEAANYFMINYPGFRISLKDRFLTKSMREILWKQLYQSFRGNLKEDHDNNYKSDSDYENNDHGGDEENANNSDDYDIDSEGDNNKDDENLQNDDDDDDDFSESYHNDDGDQDGTVQENNQDLEKDKNMQSRVNFTTSSKSKRSKSVFVRWRKPLSYGIKNKGDKHKHSLTPKLSVLNERDSPKTSWKLLKDLFSEYGLKTKDDSLYWKLAIVEIYPDLDLVTTIVYLSHLHAQTGVSSYHFVAWVNMGLYPHLIDGYGQLSAGTQHILRNVKKKWRRNIKTLPNPEKFDELGSVLLTSLVDPNDDSHNSFLADLYRMNVNRIRNIPFWAGTKGNAFYSKILQERKAEIEKDKSNSSPKQMTIPNKQGEKERIETTNHLGQSNEEDREGILYPPQVSKTFYNVGLG